MRLTTDLNWLDLGACEVNRFCYPFVKLAYSLEVDHETSRLMKFLSQQTAKSFSSSDGRARRV